MQPQTKFCMLPRTEPAEKKRPALLQAPSLIIINCLFCYYIAGFAGVEETFISLTQRYFPSVFLKYE
jgi:hypothetical protein